MTGSAGAKRPDLGRRLARVISGVAIGSLLMSVALPVTALGQDDSAAASPPPKQATSISVTFQPAKMEGLPNYLVAQVTAADGSAVVDGRVTMRRTAEAFGGRTVTLGRANTDNAGIARVPIEPRESHYHVTASYSGNDSLESSKVEDDILFPDELVILPQHAPQGGLVDPQLRPLGDVMPTAIALLVVVVWLVLLVLAVWTLARISSHGRKERIPSEE